MRRYGLLVSLIVLSGSGALDGGAKDNRKALHGKWKVVSIIHDGKTEKIAGETFFIFDKDLTLKFSNSKDIFVINVDPSKDPKTMDMYPLGEESKMRKGIYSINGTTLLICLPLDYTQSRPTTFPISPAQDKGLRSIRLTRVQN
jgi:uncharacterized protein (TIGR03067 family)